MSLGDLIMILAFFGGCYALGRIAWRHIFPPQPVNTSRPAAPPVMSRESVAPPQIALSSLETDDRKAPDRPTMPVPTRDQMLDIFRVLRASGVGREALRPAWKAAGLLLDNNLWAEAKPADPEPVSVTPIAGRPTPATFAEQDPDLAYVPPPAAHR